MSYNQVLPKPVWSSGQIIALHVTRQETEQQLPIQPHSNNAGEMKLEGLILGGGNRHMKRNNNKWLIQERSLLTLSGIRFEWWVRNREGRGQEGSVLNINIGLPTSFHYYHEAWLFPALSSSSPTPELAPAKFYGRYAWPCTTRKR